MPAKGRDCVPPKPGNSHPPPAVPDSASHCCGHDRCQPAAALVQVLGVKHVLVCGHKNCGAIQAALTLPSSSPLLTNCWIGQIRDIRNQHVDELVDLAPAEQLVHLARLNVTKQVFNVCTSPVLQQMWEAGREVFVHGLFYDVSTGVLNRLVGPIGSNDQVPENLETSDGFATGGIVEGHTLAVAIKRIAAAIADRPDAHTALLSAAGGLDFSASSPDPSPRRFCRPSSAGGRAMDSTNGDGEMRVSASMHPFDPIVHKTSVHTDSDALTSILANNGFSCPPVNCPNGTNNGTNNGTIGDSGGHLSSLNKSIDVDGDIHGAALLEDRALRSVLSIAMQASRQSARQDREDLDSRVLRQMQSHSAFETAAKREEDPAAAVAGDAATAVVAAGHTSVISHPS
jgi:hypothetical protein